jgi:GNAT superfamily N-acetyltransferase
MYTIQQANPADAAIIIQLAEQTWWPTYSAILSAEQLRYMLNTIYSAENITRQLETGSQTYLLLKEGEEPVAFAAYSPREENPEIYKLHKLYCLPQTQGKGYGRMLIEEVTTRALTAGGHMLELNVNRHNQAKTFYEKIGFIVAYEEDIAIGPYWMNDYVMRKKI